MPTTTQLFATLQALGGYLYVGGVTNNRIGRLKLADADPDWTAPGSYWGTPA